MPLTDIFKHVGNAPPWPLFQVWSPKLYTPKKHHSCLLFYSDHCYPCTREPLDSIHTPLAIHQLTHHHICLSSSVTMRRYKGLQSSEQLMHCDSLCWWWPEAEWTNRGRAGWKLSGKLISEGPCVWMESFPWTSQLRSGLCTEIEALERLDTERACLLLTP